MKRSAFVVAVCLAGANLGGFGEGGFQAAVLLMAFEAERVWQERILVDLADVGVVGLCW